MWRKMKHTEAYRILGITPEDSEIEIKRKYRKLMMIYHPDASGNREDIRMSQEINEAYRFLRTHQGLAGIEKSEAKWQAQINPRAYAKRSIFVDYSFLDGRIPIRKVAYGQYLWDPYLEEFSMLAKSVSETVTEILEEHFRDAWTWDAADESVEMMMDRQIRLFHFLMQEYIEPIDCVRKLGQLMEREGSLCRYEFAGAVGISDSRVLQYLLEHGMSETFFGEERGNRILLYNDSGIVLGNLSYDEDSYYYVVNPIIAGEAERAQVEMATGTLHTDRRDLNCLGKLDVRISITLDDAVKGEMRCNAEQIRNLLNEE